MYGIEKTQKMIIAHLMTKLDAHLVAVRASMGDDKVNLVPIKTYYPAEKYKGYRLPSAWVLPRSSEYQTQMQNNQLIAHDVIDVVVGVEGRNEEEITRAAFRYTRAMFNALHLEQLDDTDFRVIILVTGEEFSQLMVSEDERDFRKEGRLTLLCKRHEPLNITT